MNIQELPEKAGIYKVKKDSEIIYIGESKNVKQRCNQHSVTNHEDVDIEIEEIKDKEKRLKREKELLKEHQPSFNKQIPTRDTFNREEFSSTLTSEEVKVVEIATNWSLSAIDFALDRVEEGKDREEIVRELRKKISDGIREELIEEEAKA
jgi:predicted transposase